MRSLLSIVVMLLGLGGCTQHVESPRSETQAQRWTAHRPLQPPVQSFNTGDCEAWPHYEFPLVIQIDPPPVPPEITVPTPAITAP